MRWQEGKTTKKQRRDRRNKMKSKHGHLPGLGAFGLAVTRLLVDVNLFAVLRQRLGLRATALFLVDADFFLDVRVANWRLLGLVLVLVLVDGGSEGFVRLFVPFPSVCLRLR